MNQATVASPKPKPWEYRAVKAAEQASTVEALSAAQEAELLLRHQLGFMDPKVHQRLSELFESVPVDTTARLARACAFLKITGANTEIYALAADHQQTLECLKARVEANTWPINNLAVLKAYLTRANAGDSQALLAVVAYAILPEVAAALKTPQGR